MTDIDLLAVCAFNARYAHAIDSDSLETWPEFFTARCHYRITNIENEAEGLPAGLIFADSRDMLRDRVAALREANVYEQQRYRHIVGWPLVNPSDASAMTPFLVARIMASGRTDVFACGAYHDTFVIEQNQLLLSKRVVVCDSPVTDTLLALPL